MLIPSPTDADDDDDYPDDPVAAPAPTYGDFQGGQGLLGVSGPASATLTPPVAAAVARGVQAAQDPATAQTDALLQGIINAPPIVFSPSSGVDAADGPGVLGAGQAPPPQAKPPSRRHGPRASSDARAAAPFARTNLADGPTPGGMDHEMIGGQFQVDDGARLPMGQRRQAQDPIGDIFASAPNTLPAPPPYDPIARQVMASTGLGLATGSGAVRQAVWSAALKRGGGARYGRPG